MCDPSHDFIHKPKSAWIEHYATCALERIDPRIDLRPQNSWQDEVVRLIIEKYVAITSLDEFVSLKSDIAMTTLSASMQRLQLDDTPVVAGF